jgi:hypothetical protein
VVKNNFTVPFDCFHDHFIGIVLPVGPVHREGPLSAGLEIKGRESVRKAGRPPPTGQAFPIRKGGKNFFGRSGDFA